MSDWLSRQSEVLAGEPAFELERLVLHLHRRISERMEELNVSRSQLAKRMGIGRWSISRLLNTVSNMELRTLVTVASALKCRVNVTLAPLEAAERFLTEPVAASHVYRIELPASAIADVYLTTERSAEITAGPRRTDRQTGGTYATAA